MRGWVGGGTKRSVRAFLVAALAMFGGAHAGADAITLYPAYGDSRGYVIEGRIVERREAEPAHEDFVGRRKMRGQRTDGREGAEGRQGLGVVVQEGLEGPGAAVIGVLAAPSVHFAAEAAGADDEEFLHDLEGGSKARRSRTVAQARTWAPVTVAP